MLQPEAWLHDAEPHGSPAVHSTTTRLDLSPAAGTWWACYDTMQLNEDIVMF